jgi:hypothetical protein
MNINTPDLIAFAFEEELRPTCPNPVPSRIKALQPVLTAYAIRFDPVQDNI